MRALLVCVAILLTACKNDKVETERTAEEPIEVMKIEKIPVPEGQEKFIGDYFFSASDSIIVLDTPSEIFAVEYDEMSVKLNETAQAFKKEDYDMAQVTIHGTVRPNPLKVKNGFGWDRMITVKKIIEVSPATNNNVIRAGKPTTIQ